MFSFHSQKGVTLLEIILVLAIAATFIVMGMRMYALFNLDRNIRQVNYNVDVLFQSLQNYYPTICSSLLPSATPMPVPIATLQTGGFLTQWPFYQSPIVDSTSYVVQINLSTTTRNINQCYKNISTGVVTCGTPRSLTIYNPILASNTVLLGTLQVAVKVLDPTKAQAYLGMLSATCLSDLSGSTVTPCSGGPGSGSYLVWERLPSYETSNAQSSLWMSTQRMKQFNQQYTNDDFYALQANNPGYNSGAYQNYLCGG